MTREYKVTWEIDVEADSLEEASKTSLDLFLDCPIEDIVFFITDTKSKEEISVGFDSVDGDPEPFAWNFPIVDEMLE
jgi:hypothetical protein|tara:strand:+ start:210 stop:440 length:231 start_codon:yes stop_codon:yes gene_type:complete